MNSTRPTTLAELTHAIACARDRVLDLEIVVDDTRQTIDHDLEELRAAVRERDRAAEHLAMLIVWHDELTGAATSRPDPTPETVVTPHDV